MFLSYYRPTFRPNRTLVRVGLLAMLLLMVNFSALAASELHLKIVTHQIGKPLSIEHRHSLSDPAPPMP